MSKIFLRFLREDSSHEIRIPLVNMLLTYDAYILHMHILFIVNMLLTYDTYILHMHILFIVNMLLTYDTVYREYVTVV